MTGRSTPKFTLYVDCLSIMNSSGLFHSYLPLVATARKHYTGHLWYIVNNWNGKTICNNFDFETNKEDL